MPLISIHRRAVFAAALGLTLSALVGCGSNGTPLHPVTGKVTGADGKPLERATVVFHPVGATDPNFVKPRGTVGADGTFTLTTHSSGDGAPAGEYQVTVEQWLAGAKPDDPPVNRLPKKYAEPTNSGLTATVGNGPTEVPAFTVKR